MKIYNNGNAVINGGTIKLESGSCFNGVILRGVAIDDEDWDESKGSAFENCILEDCSFFSQHKAHKEK